MLLGIFFIVGYSFRKAVALFTHCWSFLALFILAGVKVEALAAGFETGLEALRPVFFLPFFLISSLDPVGSSMTLLFNFVSLVFCTLAVTVLCTPSDGAMFSRRCTSAPIWSSGMSLVERHLRHRNEPDREGAYTMSCSGVPHRCLYKLRRWSRCHLNDS